MDRSSWMRVLERWFHHEPIENRTLAGYNVPRDLPVLAGPVHTNEDGTREKTTIVIVLRATDGHWHHPEELPRLEELWGKYIIPDIETCVLAGDETIAFIPWDAIVYIRR